MWVNSTVTDTLTVGHHNMRYEFVWTITLSPMYYLQKKPPILCIGYTQQ